jgi:hypothetical protein
MARGRQTSFRSGSIGGPITRKGRMIMSGCLLLAAIVLGFGASIALYQVNRELFRSSDAIGYVLCGSGQHVDDVPSGSNSRRMICRDAAGTEVSARNNLIAVKMALPFMVLFGIPLQLLAWVVQWREVKR